MSPNSLWSNCSQGDSVTVCLASSYLCKTQGRACSSSSVSAASCTTFPLPADAACTSSCDGPSGSSIAAALQLCGSRLHFRERVFIFVSSGGEGLLSARQTVSPIFGICPGAPRFAQVIWSPLCALGISAAAEVESGQSRAKNCLKKRIQTSSWQLLNINTRYFIPSK